MEKAQSLKDINYDEALWLAERRYNKGKGRIINIIFFFSSGLFLVGGFLGLQGCLDINNGEYIDSAGNSIHVDGSIISLNEMRMTEVSDSGIGATKAWIILALLASSITLIFGASIFNFFKFRKYKKELIETWATNQQGKDSMEPR